MADEPIETAEDLAKLKSAQLAESIVRWACDIGPMIATESTDGHPSVESVIESRDARIRSEEREKLRGVLKLVEGQIDAHRLDRSWSTVPRMERIVTLKSVRSWLLEALGPEGKASDGK